MKIELTDKIKEAIKPDLDSAYDASENYLNYAQFGDAGYAYQYYYGMLPKVAREGQCNYVDRTCMSTVNGALQDMMTVFTNGEACEFIPANSDDAYAAKAATELVNQILLRDNDGYRVLESALKESLIARTGWIKRYWSEETDSHTEQAQGVQQEEIEAYLMGLKEGGIVIDEKNLEVIQNDDGTYDITVSYTTPVKRVKIEYTPLEEIRIEQQARSLKDCNYFCHVSPKTQAEIIAQGFPESKIEELQQYLSESSVEWSLSFLRSGARQDVTQDDGYSSDTKVYRVRLKEHYFKTDKISDDGSVRLYRVYEAAGDLFNLEEVSEIPFTYFAPLPVSGSVFGESVVDLTADIQDLKSWIKRAMIDNANIATYGRYMAISGAYNRRSLANNRPGDVVEIERPDAIQMLPVAQLPQGLDFLLNDAEVDVEKRTGVSRLSQGINSDILKGDHGFDSINTLLNAAQGRIRYMCRTIANNGMSDLMLSIYNLYRENGDNNQPLTVYTSQGSIQITPNQLPPRNNIKVAVALSPQEKEERVMKVERLIQGITLLSQAQNEFIQPAQRHYITHCLIESLGFKNTDDFIIPIEAYQPPEPQPDPVAMAQAQLLQAQANKLVNDAHVDTERLAFEQQHAADNLQLASNKLQFDQERGADEIQLKARELDIKANVESGKAIHNSEVNLIKKTKIDNDAVRDQATILMKGREHAQQQKAQPFTSKE